MSHFLLFLPTLLTNPASEEKYPRMINGYLRISLDLIIFMGCINSKILNNFLLLQKGMHIQA